VTWIRQIIPTRRHLLIVAVSVLVLAGGAAATYRPLPSLVSDDRLRTAVTAQPRHGVVARSACQSRPRFHRTRVA